MDPVADAPADAPLDAPADAAPASAADGGTSGREANKTRRAWWLILASAALVFMTLGLDQAGRDAPTVDEGVDVSSGVATLVHHDLRMVPEHPPLGKVIAAAPALAAHPIVPQTAAWHEGDWFDWSDDFIAANESAGRLHDVLLFARAMVLVECLACAALIYVLAKRFFGEEGANLAALAWLVTPYVVGLGHFAMIDLPFTLVTLATCVLLARWADAPSTGRTVALGAIVAAALATRHTGLVLALVVAVVVAHHLRRDPKAATREVATIALVAVVGLWLVYLGLAPGGSSAAVEASFNGLIGSQGEASLPVRLVGALPLPLEWRAGFAYLDLTSTDRPSSLLGQSWDGGRWWYFPMSAFLKVPLTVLALVVAGWITAARRSMHRKALLAYVVAPGLVLWLFLVFQPLNLGLRLALPSVALAMVGVGALGISSPGWPRGSGRSPMRAYYAGMAPRLLLVVTLLALVASSPHSLAWSPPPWTPAYRWVSDANVDAGQALYELRAWAEDHQQPYVAYDSTRGLQVRGGSRSLADVDPKQVRGWVAVGVTPLMQTRRDDLAWLRKYCPVDTLGGGAVLVYRFDAAPDPAPGPERPVPSCLDDTWSTAAR